MPLALASDRIDLAPRFLRRATAFLILTLLLPLWLPLSAEPISDAAELAEQVEIRRTTYGVPHILAKNLRAAAFALGYVQSEDYGEEVVRALLSARGEMARVFGPEHLDRDFQNRQRLARAVETYHRLPAEVRDVKEGFAEGVNHYIRIYSDELPEWMEPVFTGHDVAARDIGWASSGSVQDFLERLEAEEGSRVAPEVYPVPNEEGFEGHPDEGSNTWALAPERTTSGNAILMRNPHLSWEAGYYEVHFKVPGVINFYGDFRIGGPFTTIGGFNEHLGFSTTNNAPSTREIYALEADPERTDHYLFDGASVPVERQKVSVEFKSDEGQGHETREFLHTPLGPVIHRGAGWIYVLRDAHHRQYRVGEQLLAMMTATSFEEWEEALKLRARPRSNLAYADREGNIHYFWNASAPDLPHTSGGDTLAIPARTSSEVWTGLVPYEKLPALLNPEGGYVRNENDPFHFTNLHEPLRAEHFPAHFPEERVRLRSLHSLELLHNDRRFSLEDVVEAKHSMRMTLADRVKDELLESVRAYDIDNPEVAVAADVLEQWDNTVYADDVGAVLFETWWALYRQEAGGDISPAENDAGLFRKTWTAEDPLETPRGLAQPKLAARALKEAIAKTEEEWGDWSIAWGEVHRMRRGDLDLPASGCTGALGCFRVLWFTEDDDGRRRVRGGDGWVFAVEFGETPRAYTILAYGQSNREDSPHHTDQLEMFARGEMKPVYFTEGEIEEATLRIYQPGEEREEAALADE